jgi:nucleotide-binding universal stress UspA family protein
MYKNILFPVDLADQNSWKLALPMVLELVRAFNTKLHVLTVVPEFGMSIVSQFFPPNAAEQLIRGATEALHKFTAEHIPEGVALRHVITQGTVYESIIETAERVEADLIVMAAHRPELKDYLLGPNAARVVRHSSRSVLVVREEAGGKDG